MRRVPVRLLTMKIIVAHAIGIDVVILGLVIRSVQTVIGISGCRGRCVARVAAIIVESVAGLVETSPNLLKISSLDVHTLATVEHRHRARGEKCSEPKRYRVL